MKSLVVSKKGITFAPEKIKTVVLAQLVRASDCGSEGRGFEPHTPPFTKPTPDKYCLSGVSLYQKKLSY